MTGPELRELETLRLYLLRIDGEFKTQGKPFFPRRKVLPKMDIIEWGLYKVGFYQPQSENVTFPVEWTASDLYPEVKARMLGVVANMLIHSVEKRVYMSQRDKDYLRSLLQ